MELDENLVPDLTNFVLFCFLLLKIFFSQWIVWHPLLEWNWWSGFDFVWVFNSVELGIVFWIAGMQATANFSVDLIKWNRVLANCICFVLFCFCFCFLYLPILSDLFSPRVYGHSSELLSLFTFCLKRGIVRKNCSLDIEGMKEREKIKVTRKGKVGFNIFAFIFLFYFQDFGRSQILLVIKFNVKF